MIGSDDQNIYAFRGASVEYIRRFEEDYRAHPAFLIENYRSTANIIRAANEVIAPAAERMKAGHDINVNRTRRSEPAGGTLEAIDRVGRGRVQFLRGAGNEFTQAVLAIEELERVSRHVLDWDWAKAAVIAREWRYLQPVRSYCEARGIPVQVASADPPNFWRLRETQSLVSWLRSRDRSGLRVSELADWIRNQPEGPWWSVLKEGVDDYVHEIGDRETDRKDVLEYIAEWGRDFRKRQSGLLLLTAHRAKGLEFDDVVVLDGAWEKRSDKEDRDAARRLYYVAMTRARRSLALMTMNGRHSIVGDTDYQAMLVRNCRPPEISERDCSRVYRTLDPSEVDLSFAGRLWDGHASLRALNRLATGDMLLLQQTGDRWEVTNTNGVVVGRLARKFSPPANTRFIGGSVYAISTRFRDDSSDEYQAQLKRDVWSIVLPELAFEPAQP